MDDWSWAFLIGGIALGGVVVYLLLNRQQTPTTQLPYAYNPKADQAFKNEENWVMWEDAEGKIHAKVNRHVHPA